MAQPMIKRVTFTRGEWDAIDKPINVKRHGGFQRLLSKVLQRTNRRTLTVDLTPDDVADCRRMASYLGGGGYETRYSAIVAAAERGVEVSF